MRLHIVLWLLLPVSLVWLAWNEPAVTIRVTPRMALAPATVLVQVRIEPNAANRALDVAADSGDYLRRSSWTLDGVASPIRVSVEWRGLPAGDYAVTAAVLGPGRHTLAVARTSLDVR